MAIPKPVVCAINGGCAGIGLSTALACDVRIANEEAKLATAFSKRGLPAEEAISWLLPRIVGHAAALDLLLSSRPVSGREALALGMVHSARPPDEVLPAAVAYARDLAVSCSPAAMAAIKKQVYADWGRGALDSRREARWLMYEMRDQADFVEGVNSFVERRPAHFDGYSERLDPSDFAMDDPRP
jgi:enoyl-CoA hydratase/carnithine racemase